MLRFSRVRFSKKDRGHSTEQCAALANGAGSSSHISDLGTFSHLPTVVPSPCASRSLRASVSARWQARREAGGVIDGRGRRDGPR